MKQFERKISVIVLSKDEPELDQTLSLLKPQCESVGAECIVIDASRQRLNSIRAKHPWVIWEDFVGPFGAKTTIPHQRNFGVRKCVGDVIAFCDSGGIPGPNWLSELVRPVVEGIWHVSCGPVFSTEGGIYGAVNNYPDGTPIDSVLTGNLAFSRECFEAIGGFDERYAYGSDADFGWRLSDSGFQPKSVQRAVMTMNWGPWSLQRKRSWRYGRARARLARFHPKRRFQILKQNPEVLFYPLWLFGLAASVIAGLIISASLPVLIWLGLLLLPIAKNWKTRQPLRVVLSHLIYGGGVIAEFTRLAIPRKPPIFHCPREDGPFVDTLLEHLENVGVSGQSLQDLTSSKTFNALLLPFTTPLLRIQGVKILQIHWTFHFALSWIPRPFRRVTRWWFYVWLAVSRLSGIKIVWIAHNFLPHTPVFDDDIKARKRLVRSADAVVAFTTFSAGKLRQYFDANRVQVIPAPAVDPGDGDRSGMRERLGIKPSDRAVITVGSILPYKGIDELLRNVIDWGLPERCSLRIAGNCPSKRYRKLLENLRQEAKELADVDIVFGFLSNQEYADYLEAADAVVLPFRKITNSTSVMSALHRGKIVLVPDLPDLGEIQCEALIRWDSENSGPVEAMRDAFSLPEEERRRLAGLAKEFAGSRDWTNFALSLREVYEKVLE